MGDVSTHSISTSGDKVVIMAQVRHSQSVSASRLKPWVAAEKGGTVLCAHCTCMAGLGESCSHIAALLFAAKAFTKLSKGTSCTSQACQWLSPSMQNVNPSPIADIDFSTPESKRKKMMTGEPSTSEVLPSEPTSEIAEVPPPSQEELAKLFHDLS